LILPGGAPNGQIGFLQDVLRRVLLAQQRQRDRVQAASGKAVQLRERLAVAASGGRQQISQRIGLKG
jgi:hypothetical protein